MSNKSLKAATVEPSTMPRARLRPSSEAINHRRNIPQKTESIRKTNSEKPLPTGEISNPKTESNGSLPHFLERPTFPPRLQLFEFCDQPWLTGLWREAYMDGLDFLFRLGGIYKRMHRPFARWASASGQQAVLDMGSGNGGPIATIFEESAKEKVTIPYIYLSDRFPNAAVFQKLNKTYEGRVGYLPQSVDALAPPNKPDGPRLRSICSAFHHFEPKRAAALLDNAVQHSDGLFIMEVFERTLLTPLLPLLNLPLLMLAPFFARRRSVKKMLITTLLPVIPLMVIVDGIVSALRSYRSDEIATLLPKAGHEDWQWESGYVRYMGIFKAPYFFGYRKQQDPGNKTPALVKPSIEVREVEPNQKALTSTPWEVARWGRLLAGAGIFSFSILALVHDRYWLLGCIGIAVQLVVTALTDRCFVKRSLLRLGAQEREELFMPGGRPRAPEKRNIPMPPPGSRTTS